MAYINGSNEVVDGLHRFSDIPDAIDIPVAGDIDEAVEIDLLDLSDDPTELCTLFENENAAKTYWITVALAYAKQNKIDHAIEMVSRGAQAMNTLNPREKLGLATLLCWLNLYKCRSAPRVAPEGSVSGEVKTKDYYLDQATLAFNDASRLNPAFNPLFLAKGVLCLMRAALAGTKSATSDRIDMLRESIRAFEASLKGSYGKNVLAIMGKAKANFSLGKYAEALTGYQDVLRKRPDMLDPDPRIGIGCCFWQLGFKDDASTAWKRSLELNPNSKIANILLGLYFLDSSSRVPINSEEFIQLYKTAMTQYTQKAFKLDKDLPITCATFASYFVSKRHWPHVESLSHKAIQYTDINAVASDGWYLLARREHIDGDPDKANFFYRRADEARGGADSGYLPAKFGSAQLSIMKSDLGEAKLRLEKMMQIHQFAKSYEVMVLLGTLYAEEVFANQLAAVREDKSEESKKAVSLLENARNMWRDPKKNLTPDANLLLNLARLYETGHPDKALQCLLQAEQIEIDRIPEAQYPKGLKDDALRASLRKFLPPQLLNNIGCFYSLGEKHEVASEMFEAALDACLHISSTKDSTDPDTLVTTISFNLGRSYESRGLTERAVEVYEGLLARHDDYVDARTRLAYINLRKNPVKEGPEKITELYKSAREDLEVRSLFGWFLGRQSRKRPSDVQQDPELRHHKHTLQQFDKHDQYALVGMGNLYLMTAREMRRDTDSQRQKRSAMYARAVEFFDKALQLDSRCAYAAEGVAIALIEDRKDLKNGLAILLKVRETLKDAHIFVNLGHIYTELRQFSKAIESYETALGKEGKSKDVAILSCLGRVWLMKGRVEKNLEAYNKSLEFAQQAFDANRESSHSKFNVAFVQIQLATLIHSLPETQRSLVQLEEAASGLEMAITALDEISKSPQPPYPKQDIEQRVNMARNTQRKQLEKAIESQRKYEERNKEKLAAAVERRKAELRRREEQQQKALQQEKERQERLRKEREAIAEQDRLIIEKRQQEEAALAAKQATEYSTDSETGEKIKKKKRKAVSKLIGDSKKGRARKKESNRDAEEDRESDSSGEGRRSKKRRKLATNSKQSSKYKSNEVIVDSDEEAADEDDALEQAEKALEKQNRDSRDSDEEQDSGALTRTGRQLNDEGAGWMEVDEEDDEGPARSEKVVEEAQEEAMTRRQRGRGRIIESDEEEDEGGEARPNIVSITDTSMVDPDEDEE